MDRLPPTALRLADTADPLLEADSPIATVTDVPHGAFKIAIRPALAAVGADAVALRLRRRALTAHTYRRSARLST